MVLSADEGFGSAPLGAVGKKANGEEVGSLKLWESKFVFRREMLPSFVSEEFGRKVSGHNFIMTGRQVDNVTCGEIDIFNGEELELYSVFMSRWQLGCCSEQDNQGWQ